MKDVIRSNGIEIKKIISQQIVLRSSGNSEFNGVVNKALKLLPPSDNLRIVTNDNLILAKMSFDQWNLIFKKDIEQKKFHKLCNTFNKSSLNETIVEIPFGAIFILLNNSLLFPSDIMKSLNKFLSF